MAIFDRMKNVVDRLTLPSKYGMSNPITLTVSNDDFDPEDGSVGGTPDTYTIQGIDTRYSAYELNGGSIEVNDLKLTVAVFEVDPIVGDIVNLNSQDYRIMNVTKLSVQGQTIGNILQLRI